MSADTTSFGVLWPILASLRGGAPPGERMVLESKVLFAGRPRALLVPARDPRRAHAAVAFFITHPLRRAVAHALLLADRLLPHLGLLPRACWEDFPARSLFGAMAVRDPACAVLCGSPGPLQKVTILHTPFGDAPPRVAKVALRQSADEAVAMEEFWLRELNAAPRLAPFVPRLTAAGALSGGRRYVAMSALPGGDSSDAFGPAQRRFLAALAGLSAQVLPWREAPSFRRLRARAASLGALLGNERGLVEAVLAEIERRIGGQPLPACLAHGDFAPWNLRIEAGLLQVFDWEYAQTGANPLQDFFHFHLISRVARGKEFDARALAALLPGAASHGREVFGAASGVDQAAGTLALHYLLDVITFYTEADQCLHTQHPVLRSYLGLLARRDAWLGPLPASEGMA